MRHLLTSKYFLIVTALFLAVSVTAIWFFYPSVLKTYNDNRSLSETLARQIKTGQLEGTTVKDLAAAKTTIGSLFDSASSALPDSPAADLLLLQFEGLTKSMGLNATITVPFSSASLASQVAAPTTPTDENEIKPKSGSVGGTQPVVTTTTSSTKADFSLGGEWDYPTVLNLLTKLKTFSRWNAVTSIDLARSGDKSTATVSGKVFWSPTADLQFSGSVKELLTQANTLFGGYQSYAATPDITKEGNFGKSNPFQP